MSPFEAPPPRLVSKTNIQQLLDKFSVSSDGFLPSEPPLDKLPDDYYAPWESLISNLPSLLQTGTLRERVNALPALSITHLTITRELRRAYVILCFLAHAYIWGGDTASQTLPPTLTNPLLEISCTLDLPPVATYAALNLWNYTVPPGFTPRDLDSLQSLHTFTGTTDESWFYVISIVIEARGADSIPLMLHALEALRHGDFASATPTLYQLARCIDSLGQLVERMDERCDPHVFYHRIRPFLAGSKNMVAAGLPRGVFYDRGHGKGEWQMLRGGSNGQSSLVQFFDVVLGVEHAGGFHGEVRGYMPRPHRRFLEYLSETYPGGIKKMLMRSGGGDGIVSGERVQCEEAFRAATETLAAFRERHLQMVTRYIIIPSRQGGVGKGVVNLATASSDTSGTGKVELTGTGGTALMPFLKGARDETFRAGGIR